VEVAHEALLQEWRRLREWLDESRADIRMQRVLGNAAAEWLEANRDPGFLLRGSRLEQFEAWAAGTDLALTADEQAFMDASLAERRAREAAEAERQEREAKMERRSRNFLRGLVVVLAVAAVVAVVLSVFAFNQQGIAQDNAATATIAQGQAQYEAATAQAESVARATQQAVAEAEAQARATAEAETADERDRAVAAEQDALVQASVGLAGQAMNEMDGAMPERAVPLALEALEEYPYTWQAERALGEAVLNHRLEKVLTLDGPTYNLEVSQDGARLLSAGDDGAARVWDTTSGEELLNLSEGEPLTASWSPDESAILTVGDNGFSIQLWDAATGELRYNQELESEFWFIQNNWFPWSPDGERFVTAHDDGARIWDATNETELFYFDGHEDVVLDAAWSPAGDRIVTASWHENAFLWDASSGRVIREFPSTDGAIRFGDWSPSGDRFILRGFEWVGVYDSATGAEVLTLSLPGLWTNFVRFSPDGTQVITTQEEDGTARLWDLQTGRLISMLSGLTQGLGVSWSPSGEYATVVGSDGSVRIWDTVNGVELQRFPFFGSRLALWSPTEDHIYAAGNSIDEIRIYQLSSALSSIPGIPGMRGVVGFMSWSPDGRQIGRGYHDGSAIIYDAQTWEQVMTLDSGTEWVSGADWSPAGDRILTTNMDSTTRIWDASSGELMLEFGGHENSVFSGGWSPNGSRIATAGPDDPLILWEAATGEEIWRLDLGGVWVAVWSPDGSRMAITTSDGYASIRDPATGEVLLDLTPDAPGWMEGIAWSSDGKQIATFSEGNGWIIDSTTSEIIIELSSGFTSSVWDIYWSPGDDRIFASGGDGTYRVFEAATGLELLVYDLGGWPAGVLSPDGEYMAIGTLDGKTSLYPTWLTTEELIAYAKECCLVHDLTAEEREVFGLPER
jgi:WD40 repeat protein